MKLFGLNRAFHSGRSLAGLGWRRAEAEFAYLRARGDVASQVTERREGRAPPGPRVAVFVHFDGKGRVWPHTRRYVTALRDCGLAVVFVTNSGRLEPESADWVEQHCTTVLLRRNRGYDFGGYRDGIAVLPPGVELLILANDSVYGPFVPLDDCLARMDFAAADIWGLTDSWQHRFHLQSFFLAFGPRALAHPSFAEYWSGVRNTMSKWAAVRFYELRMTRHFQQAGLRCAAVWDYLDLVESMQHLTDQPAPEEREPFEFGALRDMAHRLIGYSLGRVPLNPASDLWLVLLHQGFPFLKRELLRLNPSRAPHMLAWHRLVRRASPAAYAEIVADLQRSLRHEMP